MDIVAIIVIGILVLIIIIIIASIARNNNNVNSNNELQVCMNDESTKSVTFNNLQAQQIGQSCPPGTTCRDSGGQTYFTDPRCVPNGGLGCNAIANDPESRFCCFGPYSEIPCPGMDICPSIHSPNCKSCPYPEVCQISDTNPQTFNYDPFCVNNGGGKGCNWDNDLGCRLCGGPNYADVPCLYEPNKCSNNSQCTGGFICQNGTCVKGQCTNNTECTGGQICINGQCVDSQCGPGKSCPPGTVCELGKCEKICCTSDSDCASDSTCVNNFCKHKVPKPVRLTFRNQSGASLLLGANGPTPILPVEGTWILPNNGELNIDVPPDWTQTAQAAQCNNGVVGPRFWARTACEIGQPYWAEAIVNVRDIIPAIITETGEPPENSTVGDGVAPNTYLIGTKYVNMLNGEIFYKSYGSKWVKINQNLHISISPPNPSVGKLGDIYFQPTTSLSTGIWYIKHQKAQCLSGNCGDSYDCSYNNLADKAPASLAELCFDCGLGLHYYDVSLVDGYNLSVDIQPVGASPTNPYNPDDPFWNKTNLCINNVDLRAREQDKFSLNVDMLSESNPSVTPNNYIIGVFSNCGYYEYPSAPAGNCDPNTDKRCKLWRQFCCQSTAYGQDCTSDADCEAKGAIGGACWNGKCQCRAYYKCQDPGPTPPSNSTSIINGEWIPRCCNEDICFENRDPAAQPISGGCNTADATCIGDDKVHNVCPKAYSWPNDPTTFDTNATSFIITFSPGGTNYGNVPEPIEIPLCSSLNQSIYNYNAQASTGGFCSVPINNGATYTCAQKNFNGAWPCDVDAAGASCQNIGTLCRWK